MTRGLCAKWLDQLVIVLAVVSFLDVANGWSFSSSKSSTLPVFFTVNNDIRRRDLLWKVPLGSVVFVSYGTLFQKAFNSFTRGIQYPEEHEKRVRQTIAEAFDLAARSKSTNHQNKGNSFRVLEVGIGSECRLLRRGLYDKGIDALAANGIGNLEWTGLDIVVPSPFVWEEAQNTLRNNAADHSIDTTLSIRQESIEQTSFMAGYFDCIICCFTLCSVDDPAAAVEEMKRLLRPLGGTLGYIEHVAVQQEPYPLLKWEQRNLDKLQQAVADNCHLNRATDQIIAQIMTPNEESSTQQQQQHVERFLVDTMWPVSMQSCGVVQLWQ